MTATSNNADSVATTTTPSWLLTDADWSPPDPAVPPRNATRTRTTGRGRRSFLAKTLTSGAGLLRQAMFSEDIAGLSRVPQRLDPRLKIGALMVLLLATGLAHHLVVLAVAYLLTLWLAVLAGLPLGFFVKRVWLFIPLFTGVMLVPATLSIVTPGEVLLPLWHWRGVAQGVTGTGLSSAGLVLLRVATSISLVLLVTVTTPWPRLLAGLRALGVPRMFVLVIAMAYRYVFLLLGTVTDMYQARTARTVTTVRHDRGARRFLSFAAGALFGRAHHLAEEVHLAMVSRGYRGDAHTLDPARFGPADRVAAALVLAIAGTIYGGDLFLGH